MSLNSTAASLSWLCPPTLPKFSWDYKALKLVVTLVAQFTIYPLKNIKITIYTHCYDYDVLYADYIMFLE